MPRIYWCSQDTVAEHYRPSHIKFVLRNLADIKLGDWPPRDRPDGTAGEAYVESPGELPAVVKKGFYAATWENVISIAVEVERRIDATGEDGRFARAIYTVGTDYWELARLEGLEPKGVQDRVKNAISYASGKRRKTKPYERWVKDADRRRGQGRKQL